MRIAAVLTLLMFCSCSSAAKRVSAPADTARSGHTSSSGSMVESPSGDSVQLVLGVASEKPIAACTIEIVFNPEELRLEKIEEDSPSIVPYARKETFVTGRVKVMFVLHDNFSPKVYLATARFTRLRPGKSTVRIRVLDSYDEAAKPVQSTADPDEMTF